MNKDGFFLCIKMDDSTAPGQHYDAALWGAVVVRDINVMFHRCNMRQIEIHNSLVTILMLILVWYVFLYKKRNQKHRICLCGGKHTLAPLQPPSVGWLKYSLILGAFHVFIHRQRWRALGLLCSCQWVHTCTLQQQCTASFLSIRTNSRGSMAARCGNFHVPF